MGDERVRLSWGQPFGQRLGRVEVGVWACGVSGELGHGLALEVVVAVGPDRCGLAVCVVLVSFPKISQARPCLVPKSGTYPPAPERPALGAFEKHPMVEVIWQSMDYWMCWFPSKNGK